MKSCENCTTYNALNIKKGKCIHVVKKSVLEKEVKRSELCTSYVAK